ncbi:dTDP-4-dehydrorhamnose 3,5-epimerase [Thermodesulfobacteriota bacterium]
MRFEQSAEIPQIIIIRPEVFEDDRGYFLEMYHKEKFEEAGIKERFVQDNRARSKNGTLRGLHYQIKKPQGKLIWALSGEIFDVAVDIRKDSPTFGKWTGIVLSGENKIGLYIPPDFAHGYCVLSDDAEVLYKCTALYAPQYERCIRWDDPEIAIDWPVKDPVLSEKDKNAPFLREAELPN